MSEAVQAEPHRRKDSQCSLKADIYLDGQKAGGVQEGGGRGSTPDDGEYRHFNGSALSRAICRSFQQGFLPDSLKELQKLSKNLSAVVRLPDLSPGSSVGLLLYLRSPVGSTLLSCWGDEMS